jgi:hypothetical protein
LKLIFIFFRVNPFFLSFLGYNRIYDVLGKLASFHVLIAINVDVVEKLNEAIDKLILLIRRMYHRALQKSDKLWQFKAIFLIFEFLFQGGKSFVVQSHHETKSQSEVLRDEFLKIDNLTLLCCTSQPY